MSKERAVNLSIENGVLVVECLRSLRISNSGSFDGYFTEVYNLSNNALSFKGHASIVEYYLNIEPKYKFMTNFKRPRFASNYYDIFTILIGEGEGCLLTMPNSKENIFVYNESGLLCFRGSSTIIDKNKTTAFDVR